MPSEVINKRRALQAIEGPENMKAYLDKIEATRLRTDALRAERLEREAKPQKKQK